MTTDHVSVLRRAAEALRPLAAMKPLTETHHGAKYGYRNVFYTRVKNGEELERLEIVGDDIKRAYDALEDIEALLNTF